MGSEQKEVSEYVCFIPNNEKHDVKSEIVTLSLGTQISSVRLPAYERELLEKQIPENIVEQMYTVEEPNEICEQIPPGKMVQEIVPTKIVKKVKKVKVGDKTIMQVTEQVNDEKPEIIPEIVILTSGEEISISQISEPERTKLIKALPNKYSKEEETFIYLENIMPGGTGEKSEPQLIKKMVKKTKVGNKVLTKVLELKDNQEPKIISEILTLPSGQEVPFTKLPSFE